MVEVFAEEGAIVGEIGFFGHHVDVAFVACFSEGLGC